MIPVIIFILSILSFILSGVSFYGELHKGTKPYFIKLFITGIVLFFISEFLFSF